MLHSTERVTANDVKSEILWNNRFTTIDRNPLNHGEWYRNSIVHIKELLDKNETFHSHPKIGELFNVKCSFLYILQVRHNLPRNWILLLRDDEFKDNTYTNKHICNLNIGHTTKNVEKTTCSDFYWILVSKNIIPPICITKWTELYLLTCGCGLQVGVCCNDKSLALLCGMRGRYMVRYVSLTNDYTYPSILNLLAACCGSRYYTCSTIFTGIVLIICKARVSC